MGSLAPKILSHVCMYMINSHQFESDSVCLIWASVYVQNPYEVDWIHWFLRQFIWLHSHLVFLSIRMYQNIVAWTSFKSLLYGSCWQLNSRMSYCPLTQQYKHLWHENKLLTAELSVYPGFVFIWDTRTNYSLVSFQYIKALLSSVIQEQTTPWWAVNISRLCCHLWYEKKLLTGELSIYPGFVVICDTRSNYSLVSCQYTQALLSSVTQEQTTHWWALRIPRLCFVIVTQEQTTHWWAVSIPRLCCHILHKNKLQTGELSEYPGLVVICDTRTKYSLMSCQDTQALLSSVTPEQTTHWWAVNIPRLCCHIWHKNKLLTGELSIYPGLIVICDTRTNYSLVSCQYTQA